MTAPMYILLILALIFANAPSITTKSFSVFPLEYRHLGYHLVELVAGFILTAVLAYIFESRAGAIQHQG